MSMRSIYRKIAKEHGVSVAEVKRDMQAAIDYAYKKQGKSVSESAAQNKVKRKDDIPTPDEFIKHAVKRITP